MHWVFIKKRMTQTLGPVEYQTGGCVLHVTNNRLSVVNWQSATCWLVSGQRTK